MGACAVGIGAAGGRTITSEPEHAEEAEWELVQRTRAGDRASFEQLYRRHAGRIHGLCLRLTARREEAEELTQEVFVRAWTHRDTFREPGHFPAWLTRVAVNLATNTRRSAARRPAPAQLNGEPGWGVPVGERNGARLDLERAISDLPRGARTVLVLHDVYGYRHEEIASMTGTAVGTSKAQLHRARRSLRERLDR